LQNEACDVIEGENGYTITVYNIMLRKGT